MEKKVGFFVLVVLVVEGILGIVAGLTEGTAQIITISGILFIIIALIGVVVFLSVNRPEALRGERPTKTEETVYKEIDIENVFCASTKEFEMLGVDKDVAILEREFKNRLIFQRNTNLTRFRSILLDKKFQVVHFLGYVDPDTGDMRFDENEILPPQGFLKLMEVCGAHIVVLATCKSLALAATILPITNVIAAMTEVEDNKMVTWIDCFYSQLARGKRLSEAYQISKTTTDAKEMTLLMKYDLTVSSGSINN